ncbi:MAG: SH3 domain-containing protein [Boseongicola sp.]|nr:SH3 domain-containing protein [Boseongicola sp.]MDD9979484.1 SH3 domain-containing protein [Boseongicola sp.]
MRPIIVIALAAAIAVVGAAQLHASERGKVTNLPIPRYVSLKAAEGNVRRGPSLSHRIDWVFTRRNMPLEVTGEYGHWRRVRDRDGQGGWVHYSLLSGVRHVIVEQDMLEMRVKPDAESPVNAIAEAGVIARLESCELDWCRISSNGSGGWVLKRTIWGVKPEEIKD